MSIFDIKSCPSDCADTKATAAAAASQQSEEMILQD